MSRLLLLNGPNLNLLGTREPEIYGSQSLDEIVAQLSSEASAAGHSLSARQSNSEADLVERIHAAASEQVEFIVINAASLTHTSIAIRDALLGVGIPFIEVHLSNVYARESFRHHSYLADIAHGVIVGLGPLAYSLALQAAVAHLEKS